MNTLVNAHHVNTSAHHTYNVFRSITVSTSNGGQVDNVKFYISWKPSPFSTLGQHTLYLLMTFPYIKFAPGDFHFTQ